MEQFDHLISNALTPFLQVENGANPLLRRALGLAGGDKLTLKGGIKLERQQLILI